MEKIAHYTAMILAMIFAIIGSAETNSVIINWAALAGFFACVLLAYIFKDN